MRKILVFTGAGFGVPLGLPTTTEFKKVIDSNCQGEFRIALEHYLGRNFYDVEHLIATLEIFCKENSSLLKSIIAAPPSNTSQFDYVRSVISQYRSFASSLLFRLKSSLFDVLGEYDPLLAAELYRKIILDLKKTPTAISFFTTNYDLTFEDSQDELEELYEMLGIKGVDYGFTMRNQTNVYDFKKSYEWGEDVLEYKKIHGSLDFSLSGKKIIKSFTIVPPADLNKMLLVYPGFKGTPQTEPYKSLHDDLLQRLLSADYAVVIGFAFRDGYINNHFDTAMKINKGLKVYCINPCDISTLPAESDLKNFTEKYTDRFIHIKAGIEIKENPISSLVDIDYSGF